MKLIINNTQFMYDNKREELVKVFETINSEINEKDVHVSHLVVDGVDVYEGHSDYLLENLKELNSIEVITKTTKQLINEVLISTESYLNRALPEVELLTDEFYNNCTDETWSKYIQLVDGLQWIVQMVQTLDQFEQKLTNWNEYLTVITSLQSEINTMMKATENRDLILIADIIQYEILPLLSSLKRTITITIDQQGQRSDLS